VPDSRLGPLGKVDRRIENLLVTAPDTAVERDLAPKAADHSTLRRCITL